MKLKSIASICDEIFKQLDAQYTTENGIYTFTNHIELSNNIGRLIKLDIIPGVINGLFGESESILTRATKIVRVDGDTGRKFLLSIEKLKICLSAISIIIKSNTIEDSETTVLVKLPETKTIGEFSDIIRDLSITLESIVEDPQIHDGVGVGSFDNGSLWLELTFKTVVGLNILGALVWSGYAVLNKKIEYDKNLESLRSLKISNDHIQAVQSGIEANIKLLIDSEAKMIIKTHSLTDDAELINKLTHSIERMSVMLHAGMELHPGQKATVETSKEFPKVESVGLIEPRSNKIEYNK